MIRTFMEVFAGSYKDGSEGGRDYTVSAWTDHGWYCLEH